MSPASAVRIWASVIEMSITPSASVMPLPAREREDRGAIDVRLDREGCRRVRKRNVDTARSPRESTCPRLRGLAPHVVVDDRHGFTSRRGAERLHLERPVDGGRRLPVTRQSTLLPEIEKSVVHVSPLASVPMSSGDVPHVGAVRRLVASRACRRKCVAVFAAPTFFGCA